MVQVTARKMRKKAAVRLCQNRGCNMSIHYQESIGAPVASYTKAHSLQRLSSQTSSKKKIARGGVPAQDLVQVHVSSLIREVSGYRRFGLERFECTGGYDAGLYLRVR